MMTSISPIKTILFILFIGFGLSLSANDHKVSKSYFDHLTEINKEWHNHKDACPEGTISFDSNLDKIQLHLNLVIQHLKTHIPTQFSVQQKENRLSLLNQLQAYADHKVFPINKYHSISTPYFVDHVGTNCAVGQMIYVSGHQDLVAKISKEHNYDYIKDIHTEGLAEWADKYGFTLSELKWIQPMYSPQRVIEQIANGTNGTVNKIVRDPYAENIKIIGDFTELDNLPCLGVGVYKNEQLSCLAGGIEGTINDVFPGYDGVYVTGELIHNGEVYPIAKYNGSWSFIEIPNRSGAIGKVISNSNYHINYEVVISHDSVPNQQEIWQLLEDNTWEKQARINGFIADITRYKFHTVYVGHFDTVFVHFDFLNTTVEVPVNNVAFRAINQNQWHGIGTAVSDTVKVAEEIGNALFLGGTCSSDTSKNNICISRYFNSVLQPIFLNKYSEVDFSINAFTQKIYSGNKFIFGGKFDLEEGMTSGHNLAAYNLSKNTIEPLAELDAPVNALAYDINNHLYIGGDFLSDQGQPVKHLGTLTSTVDVEQFTAKNMLKIYPNPFTSTLHLEGIEEGASYTLFQNDGRTVKSGTVKNEKINNLGDLPTGTYLLHVETSTGALVKKVLK